MKNRVRKNEVGYVLGDEYCILGGEEQLAQNARVRSANI